ncbi:fructosamine kinase family protein [Kribbella sp. NBC_01505]|uniref:fructosamine kinase family protein n=1 Tax=Kribbella sp. NBC_01505 TaxID=2903580 RepID=UPI00386DF84F
MTESDESWSDDFAPAGLVVTAAERLTGGFANSTWLATLADNRTVVVKTSRTAPPGLFAEEAAGLELMSDNGVHTPAVLAVSPRSLTLEALSSELPDVDDFWEQAGRMLARLHEVTSPRFGWDHDGWLGRLPQRNAWDDDGHRFFATQRILRYLDEPKAIQALTAADIAGLERLCDRLGELVPAAPAVLNHGDLWRGNVLSTTDGDPAFIDPAMSWTWAEADLSMAYCTGGIPESFFAAYHELRPPEPGWRERMELLNLRELLSVVAHFGPVDDYVPRIRGVLKQFL